MSRTELQMIQELLKRRVDDPDVSPEFRVAATRWELELSTGKYLRLTEKQATWLSKVWERCEAHDIGVDDEDDDFGEGFYLPDLGDK